MSNVEFDQSMRGNSQLFSAGSLSVIRASSFLRHWVFRHSSFLRHWVFRHSSFVLSLLADEIQQLLGGQLAGHFGAFEQTVGQVALGRV